MTAPKKGISPGVVGIGWDDTTPARSGADAADLLLDPEAARWTEPMTPAEITAGAAYIRRNGWATDTEIAEMVTAALAAIAAS